MRTSFLLASAVAGLCATASATVVYHFNAGLPDGGQIPDANPAGWSDTRTLTGLPVTGILDLNVTLTLAGGYNGDLYGYLVHDSGFSVLLNRVGRTAGNPVGYDNAGLNVSFDDEAPEPIDFHRYQEVPGFNIAGGTAWRPDGRDVSPATVLDTDVPDSFLSSFVGLDANGDWTLFLADLSGGDVSTVTDWGLVIDVPEPEQIALLLAALAYVGVGRVRRMRRDAAG